MIRPSAESEPYAVAKGLRPFSQWVRLTNQDTYITGPFDFAVVNGRKSRDRVPTDQLQLLSKYSHLFTNEIPSLSLPEYSVHYGQFHTSFKSDHLLGRLDALYANPSTPDSV